MVLTTTIAAVLESHRSRARRLEIGSRLEAMDGVHDMGGMHGFGPVVAPDGDAVYHGRWEPRVFAIQMLVGVEGLGAGPGGRPTREEMDPAHYLAASYYERWLYSAEQRLLRKGTIAPGDVEAMMERLAAGEPAPAHRDAAMAERGLAALRTEHPMKPAPPETRFAVGERVRAKRMHPPGHTRCPRYVRGATGTVEAVRGADRLPDRAVYGENVEPEPVYSVVFASAALWGPSEEPSWTVRLDMWESYLEPA
jgi:nitrile hydratase